MTISRLLILMHKFLRWLPLAFCLPWAAEAFAQTQIEPSWRYLPGFFRPGQAGLEVVDIDADGRSDIVLSGSTRSGTGEFLAVLRQGSDGLRLADKIPLGPGQSLTYPFALYGHGTESILVARTSGLSLSVFAGESLSFLRSFGASLQFQPRQVADVDGDGDLEVIGVTISQSEILHLEDGSPHWTGQLVRYGISAGQLDADSPLEVVLSGSGQVRILDGAALVEQTILDGVPSGQVLTGNFDSDVSTVEIAVIAADVINILATAPSLGVISSHSAQGLDRLRAWDVDGDGVDEIVALSNAGVVALEPLGWTTVFSAGIEGGEVVLGYALGNLDSDPSQELVLATRREGSSANEMKLVDAASGVEETLFREEGGPFSDLVVGDIDGDGRSEVVIVTSSGEVAGRLVVLDASTGAELRQSPLAVPRPNTGRSFVALASLDADPQKEIIVGSSEGSWSHVRALDGLSLEVQWSRLDELAASRLTALTPVRANGDGVEDVAVVIGGKVIALDGTSGDTLWSLDALPGEPLTSHVIGAQFDANDSPLLIVSDGSSTRIIDAQRPEVRFVIPDSGNVIGQLVEGSGTSCRLVQFGASELTRRLCDNGAEESRRKYVVPDVMAVRSVSDSHGDLVLSDGARLVVQSGQQVRAMGARKDVNLGLNNQAAIFVDRGEPALVVGGALGIQRIDLDPDYVFRNDFE